MFWYGMNLAMEPFARRTEEQDEKRLGLVLTIETSTSLGMSKTSSRLCICILWQTDYTHDVCKCIQSDTCKIQFLVINKYNRLSIRYKWY